MDTIGKMLSIQVAGLAVSLTDIETLLRIGSLCLTMTFTVLVYLRNAKSKKNEKKDS